MKPYVYKNKTDQELVIPNVGIIGAGETKESDVFIENPNVELLKGNKFVAVDPVTLIKNNSNHK